VSQGNSFTVDVSSGSKCHGGQNVGGRNAKAPLVLAVFSAVLSFVSWTGCLIIAALCRKPLAGSPACPIMAASFWLSWSSCVACLSFSGCLLLSVLP
jgi:hypothetical protein